MLQILFASVAGVIFITCQSALPAANCLLWSVVLLAVLTPVSRRLLHRYSLPWGRLVYQVCLMGLAFTLAACITGWRGSQYLDSRLQLTRYEYWLVEVSQRAVFSYGKMRTRLVLVCPAIVEDAVPRAVCSEGGLPAPEREVLATYGPVAGLAPLSQPGARMILALQPQDSSWPGNPGFDQPAWQISENIVGSVRVPEQIPHLPGVHRGTAYWRDRLGQKLAFPSLVESSAFSGLALAPIVKALTLGDRSGLSQEHWDLFRETGTSHLMAISGMHLGIVSGWVYWTFLLISRRCSFIRNRCYPQWPAGLAAVAVGLAYSLLAGFSLPTQRAFLMLLFAVLGTFSARPRMVWNGLVFALLLILLWQPFAVLSAGMWLSFAAVAVVFIGAGQRIMGLPQSASAFRLLLTLQGIIFIFMLPFSLYFFQGVSLNSLVANLLAIPLVTLLLLPLCLIQMLLVIVSGAVSAAIGEWAYWLVDVLFCGLQWLNQQLPFYLAANLSLPELVLLCGCALLLVLPSGWLVRCLCGAIFLVVLVSAPQSVRTGVYLLNQSAPFAVLQKGTSSLVIDASPGLSDSERRLLESLGPGYLPAAAHSYYSDLWRVQPWQGYLVSGAAGERSSTVALCRLSAAEQRLLAAELSLTRWQTYPLSGVAADRSDQACVFSFYWQGKRWLWLGLLSARQQYALLNDPGFAGERFDYVMAPIKRGNSSNFSGAVYNRLEGAQWFVWEAQSVTPGASHQGSSGDYGKAGARGIRLHSLRVSGALWLQGGLPQAQPLVPRRFYHPVIPDTDF